MSWILLFLGLGTAAVVASLFPKAQYKEELVAKRPLLLVHLSRHGDEPLAIMSWAQELLRDELGIDVAIDEKAITIPRDAFHHKSGLADAVKLVESVEKSVRPDLAVLGLTEYDLYSPLRRDLTFVMGSRKGWAGLISSYRMTAQCPPETTVERLRIMLLRYAAELVCDAQRNDEPQSILYDQLQKPDQLDLMVWPPE